MSLSKRECNQHRVATRGVSRRAFLAGGAAASVGAGLVGGLGLGPATRLGVQEQEEGTSPAELVTEPTQRAIDRGLSWLARRQVRSGPNRGSFGQGGYSGGVAVASLGGLAFMCGGSAPGDGPYGDEVNRCVDFVLGNVRDSGYIALSDNSANENMYGHGFSMLFLAQAYGMTQKAELGEKLRKAVQLTLDAQNEQGGWRYQPVKSDADLSVTVCQIMGLRAARDAGIHVPDEVRTKCIDYVKQSQNANGSFRYTLQGGHSTFAMTAAGVTSLYSAGIYDSDQVMKALKHLAQFTPGSGSDESHYFYAHYYAVQAMWHAGGEHWSKWYPAIRDDLLNRQSKSDGSWHSSMAGPEFGTAMAGIILQIPFNFLPVFSP